MTDICSVCNNGGGFMLKCIYCDAFVHESCLSRDEDAIYFNVLDMECVCEACTLLFDTIRDAPSSDALQKIKDRSVPQDWGVTFPEHLKLPSDMLSDSQKASNINGYRLYAANHVNFLQTSMKGAVTWLRCLCIATQKKETYNLFVAFKIFEPESAANDTEEPVSKESKLLWSHCSCDAGVTVCKHLKAMLYSIQHHALCGTTTLEVVDETDVPTPTGRLQVWHMLKPTSDEPLLFADIKFIKHKPSSDTSSHRLPRRVGQEIKVHEILPTNRKVVAADKIESLVVGLRGCGFDPPALKNLEKNNFQPKLSVASNNTQAEAMLIEDLWSEVEETDIDLRRELSSGNDREAAFLQKIIADLDMCKYIELNTRFQSQNSLWFQERVFRATASIIKSLTHTRKCPFIHLKNKRKRFYAASVNHGINNENAGFTSFVKKFNEVESPGIRFNTTVGLVINPAFPFLGASPDRLILVEQSLWLVEVKCPFSAFKRKIKLKSMFKEKNFYVQIGADKKYYLKKNHDYYYQIQCQLLVTNLTTAILAMFVPPNDVEYLKIERDEEIAVKILNDVYKIYQDVLLPSFTEECFPLV